MLKDSVGVDNWHAYLAEMEQHGRTWGDEATLLAMSVWLDCMQSHTDPACNR